MNNFKKGDFRERRGDSGGRPKFGNRFGGRDRGDRDRRSPELFQAVCAECRKQCQVPFRPTGDKPVYCRDCFNKQGYKPGRNSNGADGPRPDFQRDFSPARNEQRESAQPQSNIGVEALYRKLSSLESKVNLIFEIITKKSEVQSSAISVEKIVPQVAKKAKAKISKTKTSKKK